MIAGHGIPMRVSFGPRVCFASHSVALAPRTSTLLSCRLGSQSVQQDGFALVQPNTATCSVLCDPEVLVVHLPAEDPGGHF